MRALRLNDSVLRLERDAPLPARRGGDVRLRVRYAGICRTDLELVRGYMGFEGIPGHEFVGVVTEAGTGSVPVGARVVSEINCACGTCDWCRAGRREHCASRTVIGIDGRPGVFADFVDVPPENLHVLPGGVPERVGALVEPLAAALKGLEDGRIEPRHRTAVLGDGPIGLLTALGVARAGGAPVLIGRHREKLARVEEVGVEVRLAGGAAAGSDASTFDRVVDCTGRSEGLGFALRLVRPRGVVVLKTTVAGPHRVDLAPLVIDEVRIVGSRCGDFRRAIGFLEADPEGVGSLITAVYPIEAWRAAFDHAADPASLKILIRIGAPEE